MGMAEECFLADAAVVARAAPGEAAKPQLCPQPRGTRPCPLRSDLRWLQLLLLRAFLISRCCRDKDVPGWCKPSPGLVPLAELPPQAEPSSGVWGGRAGPVRPEGAPGGPRGSLSAQRPQEILGAAFPCPAHWKHLVLGSPAEQGSRPALGCPHGPGGVSGQPKDQLALRRSEQAEQTPFQE